jgi:hypothetical protein
MAKSCASPEPGILLALRDGELLGQSLGAPAMDEGTRDHLWVPKSHQTGSQMGWPGKE